VRQALRYTLVTAAVLLIYAGSTCALLIWDQRSGLDRKLLADLADVEARMQRSFPDDFDPELLIEVRGPDGNLIYRNAGLGDRVLAGPPTPAEGAGVAAVRSERLHDGRPIRLAAHRTENLLIRVARLESPLRFRLRPVLRAFVLALPIALAVAFLAGWRLSRPPHSLQPHSLQ
jgi:hypothetical protein